MLGSARSASSFAHLPVHNCYVISSGSGSSSSRSGGRSPEAEPTPKADLISRQLLTLVDKQSVEFVAKTKKKNFAPEEFGEVITTFYDALADAIRTKEDDDETVSICMDRAEANITSEIYQKLFAQEEDEAADIGLKNHKLKILTFFRSSTQDPCSSLDRTCDGRCKIRPWSARSQTAYRRRRDKFSPNKLL